MPLKRPKSGAVNDKVKRTLSFTINSPLSVVKTGRAMGMGLLLSQISAVAVFCGFVLIVKGGESIPYMLDDLDFKKVKMNSFEYEPEEYERLGSWIKECLKEQGIKVQRYEELRALLLSLCKKTEEKNAGKKVLGECVLRFIDEPEIIIKDSGELFRPDIEDDRCSYNVLMSCNRNTIRL